MMRQRGRESLSATVFFCIFFLATTVTTAFAEKGNVAGRMLLEDGTPMAGGMVFLHPTSGPPPSDKYLLFPQQIAFLDKDGHFMASIPVGTYYLEAILRIDQYAVGPAQDGDYFFTSRDAGGKLRTYRVKGGETLDFGEIAEAAPYKGLAPENEITGISGIIHDTQGSPKAGFSVFAYTCSDLQCEPLFVSQRTGEDGRYLVGVKDGGTYYLKVSGMTRGASGDGRYGEEEPSPVIVQSGAITREIDIVVR